MPMFEWVFWTAVVQFYAGGPVQIFFLGFFGFYCNFIAFANYLVHDAIMLHHLINCSCDIAPFILFTSSCTHCKLSGKSLPPSVTGCIWSSLANSGVSGTPDNAHRYSCNSISFLKSVAVALVFSFNVSSPCP